MRDVRASGRGEAAGGCEAMGIRGWGCRNEHFLLRLLLRLPFLSYLVRMAVQILRPVTPGGPDPASRVPSQILRPDHGPTRAKRLKKSLWTHDLMIVRCETDDRSM